LVTDGSISTAVDGWDNGQSFDSDVIWLFASLKCDIYCRRTPGCITCANRSYRQALIGNLVKLRDPQDDHGHIMICTTEDRLAKLIRVTAIIGIRSIRGHLSGCGAQTESVSTSYRGLLSFT